MIAYFPVEKTWASSYQGLGNLNLCVSYKELCKTQGTESYWRAAAVPSKSMEMYGLFMIFRLIIHIYNGPPNPINFNAIILLV